MRGVRSHMQAYESELLHLSFEVACHSSLTRFPQMITFREFDKDDARKWFPISFLLVLVIYTGSKALVCRLS